MGITLMQSGLGDADISWGADDFDSPVTRIFYSVIIDTSAFNGKYIANNLPPRLHHAGQVTLLHSGYVVHHEFVEFFKRDLGVFCYDPSYRQVVNVYPVFFCADDPPDCETIWVNTPKGPDYYTSRRRKLEAENPQIDEENLDILVNCDTHQYLAEIAPFKLGLLRCVNQVFIEVFSPGISLVVEVAE